MIKHMNTRELTAWFRAILTEATKDRCDRENLLESIDGWPECGWSRYERNVMLNAVNTIRESRGLGQVTVDDVWRVEQQAVGHSDYVAKFALYCAELCQ